MSLLGSCTGLGLCLLCELEGFCDLDFRTNLCCQCSISPIMSKIVSSLLLERYSFRFFTTIPLPYLNGL